MKRFLILFGITSFLFEFQILSFCQKSVINSSKPNIIIIYVDDLGYGDLSCYDGNIPSPNIDRIAEEGIRFTNFYVAAPACTPSRYSLLTGSYPQRSKHGLKNALMPLGMNKHYLDTTEITLAKYLKSLGYNTSVFGKWHLGFKNSNEWPNIHGFDEFAGFKGGAIDYFTHVYASMGHDWYINGKEIWEEGYSTNLITNYTLDFIDRMSKINAPFFSYVAYNAPHTGRTDPDNIIEHTLSLEKNVYNGYKVINSLQAPSAYVNRFKHIENPYRRVYSAMVSCLDDNVGKIIDKLEENHILNNTIIWFISDNGGWSERFFGYANNGGLKGEKGSVYEGGIKVPGLLMWKDKILSGQVISHPICNIDVLPTLLSVLNISLSIEQKKVMDGIDMSPLIFNNKTIKRTLFWKFITGNAIREGNWKLVNNSELYNLDNDPFETYDISKQYPGKVTELNNKYKEIYESSLKRN